LPGNLGKHGICSNYSYDSVASTWEKHPQPAAGTAMFTFRRHPSVRRRAAKNHVLAEDHFRRTGLRERIKVSYRCAADGIFAVKKYAAALNEICAQRDIDAQFAWKLTAVDAGAREATFENTKSGEKRSEHYDMLHVTPPMSAPTFISAQSAGERGRFCRGRQGYLQHTRYSNVFSLGDSSSLPTSKTAARRARPIAGADRKPGRGDGGSRLDRDLRRLHVVPVGYRLWASHSGRVRL
jgi:sulfide:quinone oxidoreductase